MTAPTLLASLLVLGLSASQSQIAMSAQDRLSKEAFLMHLAAAFQANDSSQLRELARHNMALVFPAVEELLANGLEAFAEGRSADAQEALSRASALAAAAQELLGQSAPLEAVERVRRWSSEQRSQRSLADALRSEAETLYFDGELEQALHKWAEALRLYRALGDRLGETSALTWIGIGHWKSGDYIRSLESHLKGLELGLELGHREKLAKAYNGIGLVYWNKGDYAHALENFENALPLWEELGDRKSQGAALSNIGLVLTDLGKYPEALEAFENAARLARETGFQRLEANVAGNVGAVYTSLGEFAEAKESFERALELDREIGYRNGEGQNLGQLGVVARYLGEYAKALDLLEQALQIARETGFKREASSNLEEIGQVYQELGDFPNALARYSSALEINQDVGLREEEAYDHFLLGTAYQVLGHDAKAREHLEQALEIDTELGYRQGVAGELLALANLHRDLGRYDEAEPRYRRALEIAEELDAKSLQAEVLNEYGSLLHLRGNHGGAMARYAQALRIAEAIEFPGIAWRLHYNRGKVHEKEREPEQAYQSYRAAIELIDSLRGQLKIEEFKVGFLHDKLDVYNRMVLLLLELGRDEEAFEYAERAKSRAFLDLLGNARINIRKGVEAGLARRGEELLRKIDQLIRSLQEEESLPPEERRSEAIRYFNEELAAAQREYQEVLIRIKRSSPEYASLLAVATTPLAEIQGLLADSTALLEYFIGEEAVIIFVITGDDFHSLISPKRRRDIESKVELFRALGVERVNGIRSRDQEWQKPLKSLSGLLVQPMIDKNLLHDIEHLIIVPHGVLFYLPFQALILEDGRYLIEDYTISYLPSASVLSYARLKNTGRRERLLALAPLPKRLIHTRAEISAIARQFGSGATVRIGREANEAFVKREAAGYDLIHFATHGRLAKSNPLFSRIDLAPANGQDGRLEVHEIMALRLTANLVTLSGCETALGGESAIEVPPGDDFFGLTRAFLYAGTASVLASLWEVNDQTTAALMERFYRHLQRHDKAQALALAQRELLAEGTKVQPYHWAPFVLVGDHR
jgi:CHAT domain-containing protein/Tfp pilus assembly protein PilF